MSPAAERIGLGGVRFEDDAVVGDAVVTGSMDEVDSRGTEGTDASSEQDIVRERAVREGVGDAATVGWVGDRGGSAGG